MSGSKMKSSSGLLAAAMVLAACQTVATEYDKPARITDPDASSRAALQQTVNAALNTEVVLADDALTNSSQLFVERVVPKSIEGSPAGGRTMEMPLEFRLVINGDDCVLIDMRDDSRHVLQDTSCIAED
jgi:hypothetical protein